MKKEECTLCNLEDKKTLVYEDNLCFAIISKNPINKHHVLVAPKEHYESFIELPDKLASHIFLTAKEISRATRQACSPDAMTHVSEDDISGKGYNLVSHYKLHIIPRFEKDVLLIDWSPLRGDEDVEARSKYAKDIIDYLK